MSDTGWQSPSTMADDDAVGTVTWANPDNAKVSDNSYATASPAGLGTFVYIHYLKATNFNFSIPVGATINGILVEAEVVDLSPYNSAFESITYIVKADGSYGTANKVTNPQVTQLPTTEAYISFGASNDLWSETWAYTDINDSDFGVGISFSYSDEEETGDIKADHIRIKVYYTVASATIQGISTIQGIQSITL